MILQSWKLYRQDFKHNRVSSGTVFVNQLLHSWRKIYYSGKSWNSNTILGPPPLHPVPPKNDMGGFFWQKRSQQQIRFTSRPFFTVWPPIRFGCVKRKKYVNYLWNKSATGWVQKPSPSESGESGSNSGLYIRGKRFTLGLRNDEKAASICIIIYIFSFIYIKTRMEGISVY